MTTTFAEVLTRQVGLNDKFAELGGDSFLAEVLTLALSERASIPFLPSSLDEAAAPVCPKCLHGTSLSLMRTIKLAFDPNSILNPGKLFSLPQSKDH